jgi:pyridoxine kinase|nr:pyridoxamine kinase [Megasphaera hominis]
MVSVTIKRVLAIHDLCSFGRCSLTAAIPVISALGSQVCPFPTALFSNNLTYGEFVSNDLTPFMADMMDKWEKLNLHFDAIYSGFLANAAQTAVVREAVTRFAKDGQLVIVDPAMADDGQLYAVFDQSMVEEMKKLVAVAGLITPNYTEACLLTDTPWRETAPTRDELETLCRKLLALGPKQIIITSVPGAANEIQVVSQSAGEDDFQIYAVPRIPFGTCGTGDIFTSVITGCVLKGKALAESTHIAADFLSEVIQATLDSGIDPRQGIQLEDKLPALLKL